VKLFCVLASSALLLLLPIARAANPVPFLSQPLVPASVAPGGAAFTLTVNGTGFVSGSVVNFNSAPQPTTFVSQGQLKAQIAASLITKAGTALITVSSGGVVSNTVFLPILSPVSSIHFAPSVGAAGGLFIGSVIAADFNADGKLDLAYTTGNNLTWATSWTVGILLGRGDGTFQRKQQYTTLRYPGAFAGDINGDGKVDLVVLDTSSYLGPVTISVFLGNGNGTFQQRKDYPTTLFGTSTAVLADFNGDGTLDLAFNTYNEMAVLLGRGDGTFQPAVLSPGIASVSSRIAVGDFNGDGKLDLAFASLYNPPLSVELGNGDGTFQPATVVSSPAFVDHLVLADFNGDGTLDIATAGQTGASVIPGNGDGTFGSPIVSPDLPFPSFGFDTADLNGDGKLDLVIAHNYHSHVTYLIGNGDGTFQNYKVLDRAFPADLVLGDFNGDGHIDFAMVTDNGTDNGNSSVSTTLQVP
jgi:VCBS repeat protein